MYELMLAKNLDMEAPIVKAVYKNKAVAIQALQTEIALAQAEHGISAPAYCRFIGYDGFVSVDYGSHCDFIGLTGITLEDLR